MRRISKADYPYNGELFSKNFDTNTMATIGKPFRFKQAKQNKDMVQILKGSISTDGGMLIETVDNLEFKRGDRIVYLTTRFEITNIELQPIMTQGVRRGITRYKKVITLT